MYFACQILKTSLDERLEAALSAESSFQSKKWQLQGVAVIARYNYLYLAVVKKYNAGLTPTVNFDFFLVPVFVSCSVQTSSEETKGPLDVLLDVQANSLFEDLLKNTLRQLGFTQEDIENARGTQLRLNKTFFEIVYIVFL